MPRSKAFGPHDDLLTIVKRRKLQWYYHVSRSSGLAKTILQSTVKGGRKQRRQRKRWEDIKEWTGLEFAKSQRAVKNREKWRKLVAKSSDVPQRPLRLGIDDDDNNDDCLIGFPHGKVGLLSPGESQLRQSCANQLTQRAGCFSVSIIH